MKKLILSIGLVLLSYTGMSQVIFSIEQPAAIQGFQEFTSNGDGSSWGLATLVGFSPILADVVLVDDGTPGVNAQGNPASATGCNVLTPGSLTGKIAMVYRGDGGTPGVGGCAFGLKAKNCADAGAVAVIIVNREEQLVNMDGGTDGASINIPVVFVKLSVGNAIKSQLDLSVNVQALIGDKTGYYSDDIGTTNEDILRAEFGSKPLELAQNATDLTVPMGAYVYNYGTNAQSDVTLNVVVKQNGTQVYSQTSSPAAIPAGDTLYITTPDFSLPTYTTGTYEVIYTTNMGTTDQFTGDNTASYKFYLTDSLWSLVELDTTAGEIIRTDGFYRPSTLPSSSNEQCVVLRDPNLGRVGIDGVYYGGFAVGNDDTATVTLDGFYVTWNLYEWNDADKTITNGTFNNMIEVANGDFTYNDDATGQEEQTIFMPITNNTPYRLQNNKTYLLCVVNNIPKMFSSFSTSDKYHVNVNEDDLIRFPMRNDFTTFANAGFQDFPVPSIALRMGATLDVKENGTVEASAFPVPAKDVITVKVNASGNATLNIVDMAGRTVATNAVKVENGKFQTSVAGLNAGTYLFNLVYTNGTSSRIQVVVSK